MDLKEYQELCKKTAKKFDNDEKEILTWGLGITGEAGDVASCIKKVHVHGNESVKDGIKENLGDTLWYIAMICNFYGWDFEEVLKQNIEKLKRRYSDGEFKIEHAKRDGKKIDWNEK